MLWGAHNAFACCLLCGVGIGSLGFVEVSESVERQNGAIRDEKEYRLRAAARINEIRKTPNMNVPNGTTIYFLSERLGDDMSDGRTPETSWRTPARLNKENIRPGSYVLFERGGIYRGCVITRPGVTYSAFGEGPKPLMYGSPENGAVPEKWKRTDIPNIWAYEIGHDDVGTLVFDGGASHAIKIVIRKDRQTGKTYNKYTGRPFASYRDLDTDLHFWHDYYNDGTGNVYLYSERNPGERFKSIEFNVKVCMFYVKQRQNDNVTIDNFTVKYVGVHGVAAGTCRGLTVRNCEFMWIGGSIHSETGFGRDYPTRLGNGVEIYGGCDDFTVDNCYFREIYDAGVTQQFNIPKSEGQKRYDQKNVRYSNNVFERCCYSVEYFLTAESGNMSRMDGFTIEDNFMFDAGIGFSEQRPDKGVAGHVRAWFHPCRNRAIGYTIRNNVFCRSKDDLVMICSGLRNQDGSSSLPRIENNVFIGSNGDRFGAISETSGKISLFGPRTQEFLNGFGANNRCILLEPSIYEHADCALKLPMTIDRLSAKETER